MSDDNPFDLDKTVIRPNPGGRRPNVAPTPRVSVEIPEPAGAQLQLEIPKIGGNPMIAAATPLLSLSAEISKTPNQGDIAQLRTQIINELSEFEAKLVQSYDDPNMRRLAHYCICALVDDVVLNTPWGQNSNWPIETLILRFYNETYGGKRFFEILSQAERDASRHVDLLELIYLSLSLGFEGELRISPRGASEHARIRESLYRTIKNNRPEVERELSPNWKGIGGGHVPLVSHIPIWVIAVFSCALAATIYVGFRITLGITANDTFQQFSTLPPKESKSFGRPATAIPPATMINRSDIWVQLSTEIEQKKISIFEDNRLLRVRLKGEELFESGSDSINPQHIALLEKIGRALKSVPGRIIVEGHTDNIPINSIRFPSNWTLSLARAKAVQRILLRIVEEQSRVSAEGRGDAQPVQSNDSAAGRAANRRIEISLIKQ